ncbi:MAG: BMP family ABC transporter substrate-binding protein [Treponema sp.]|nr:BMP family ABC transporter substrate-binding protein [Treponema sp.]
MKKLFLALLSALSLFMLVSCPAKKNYGSSIAVFIPGVMANSPTYALLDKGVRKAVDEFNQTPAVVNDPSKQATVYTMEAGTNQAEWGAKLTTLAAQQKYDVIISSNSSLPELALPILEQYPNQKFIFLDAELEGVHQIATASYNQYEQAFLAGYSSSLMSKNHKVAIVAAQEYPVMNNVIMPFFELGAKTAYADTQVDFRIVGNWYDANQGALLADALIKNGTDVILPICGGAAQGVINSAVNSKTYIAWFDSNGFAYAPGTVISSSTMNQEDLAAMYTTRYLKGFFNHGTSVQFGMKDGFVDFIEDDPNYIATVPEDIRENLAELVKGIKAGTITINEKGITR